MNRFIILFEDTMTYFINVIILVNLKERTIEQLNSWTMVAYSFLRKLSPSLQSHNPTWKIELCIEKLNNDIYTADLTFESLCK